MVPGILVLEQLLACQWGTTFSYSSGGAFSSGANIAGEVGNTFASFISTTTTFCGWQSYGELCPSGDPDVTEQSNANITSKTTSGSWTDIDYEYGQSSIWASTGTGTANAYVNHG
jgi:hypothetical protein